jgi:PD-(D/E)XK nuclease superfamily
MLRTSERGTFKRCRWKWWNEYEARLKPQTDMPPLRFGSLVHMALADYYIPGKKRGPHPAKNFAKHYAEEIKRQEEFGFRVDDLEEDEKWVEAGELGEAMLNHYVEHYGADDEWEVLVSEQMFQQLVHHPKTEKPWFWYVGTMDGIWRNLRTKKLHIVDHKTAKAIQVEYLSLDLQATGYWTWGLDWIYEQGLLKPKEKPAGMLFNHLRKAFKDERPTDEDGFRLNKDGEVSKKQPSPYFVRTPIYRDWNERETARIQVMAEFRDMEAIRQQGLFSGNEEGVPPESAYKNQGQFTCPGCWLFDVCELHEIGSDWVEMKNQTTKTWQPYEGHEIYTGDTF